MLADFGADVVKIEPPGTGDIARAWGPPFYVSEAAYFVNLNRNKTSVRAGARAASGNRVLLDLRLRAGRTV
jgi:crotonobetainyl-CoA:carnitine CoA-transferase CaiB-like acyl-CoA transferase